MSERYRITDPLVAAAILDGLELELFFPIKELKPELYLYSSAQLHSDLHLSTEILTGARRNKRKETIVSASLLLTSVLLLLIMALGSSPTLLWAAGLSLGIIGGNFALHLRRLRGHLLVITEMSHLIPLLVRAVNMATSSSLNQVVIAEVIMKGRKPPKDQADCFISSPGGNIIAFRFR